MTAIYDPLQDVAGDGFVDLNQVAAAPKPAYTGWLCPTFWRDLGIVAAVLAMIIGLLYLAYLRSKPVPVDTTKPAIAVVMPRVVVPASVKRSTPIKNATQTVAPNAINTPAIAINDPEISPPELLTPAEQDFANRQANFESKTP